MHPQNLVQHFRNAALHLLALVLADHAVFLLRVMVPAQRVVQVGHEERGASRWAFVEAFLDLAVQDNRGLDGRLRVKLGRK